MISKTKLILGLIALLFTLAVLPQVRAENIADIDRTAQCQTDGIESGEVDIEMNGSPIVYRFVNYDSDYCDGSLGYPVVTIQPWSEYHTVTAYAYSRDEEGLYIVMTTNGDYIPNGAITVSWLSHIEGR